MPFHEVTPEEYTVRAMPYNLPDNFKRKFPEQVTFKKFPHVFKKANGLWGTNECYDYLQELVINGFDRDRTGFPDDVIAEILWLANTHPNMKLVTDPWAKNSRVI